QSVREMLGRIFHRIEGDELSRLRRSVDARPDGRSTERKAFLSQRLVETVTKFMARDLCLVSNRSVQVKCPSLPSNGKVLSALNSFVRSAFQPLQKIGTGIRRNRLPGGRPPKVERHAW